MNIDGVRVKSAMFGHCNPAGLYVHTIFRSKIKDTALLYISIPKLATKRDVSGEPQCNRSFAGAGCGGHAVAKMTLQNPVQKIRWRNEIGDELTAGQD